MIMNQDRDYSKREYSPKRVVDKKSLPWGRNNKYNLGVEVEEKPVEKILKELQENGIR